MQSLAMTSFLTLGISMTTVKLLNHAKSSLTRKKIETQIDQVVRSFMLAFAIYHLGPELLETFSTYQIMGLSALFLLFTQAIQLLFNRSKNQVYIQEKYPWAIYTLLLPHFIGEGFAIAPLASNSCLNFVIGGFLIHKTLELAMLTTSTNNEIHCVTQRKIIQTLFIVITPLAIISYSASKSLFSMSESFMSFTEFLNFIVFIQLSMFCQFCPHNNKKNTKWIKRNPIFIATFLITSIINYCYPGLLF